MNQEFQWAMIVVKHAMNLPHLQELTPNETAIFTADQFGTVQNNSLNSHKMEMIMALVVKCMLCSLRAVQAVRSLVL